MGWFGKRGSSRPVEEPPSRDAVPVSAPAKPAPKPHDPLREQVESAGLPPEILDAARGECDRLESVDPASPEYAISLNFLEVILSLPWNNVTRDNLDINRAEQVLGARHHGLRKVKDRVLEFLAVKSLCARRNPRILLVDDELIARENLTIVFEADGFEVEAVGNGLEAVAAMEREPANIVVSDLKMEGMDGMELLQVLRKRWPDTKVIMITGYATVKTAVDAMRQGADQYLGKPVNLTKLRSLVAELWEQSLRAQHLRGFVLCFTGPPGMGKTSIGRAIAEALGRKFMRLSLAGLRDEAELRGHRRTYVGAMPGRIIQGIRKAGTRNPVIMLDEVDKAVQDFQGDATAVLLEMLDAEQNHAFVDHYLGLPFDLSNVLFICTANGVERLPAPLRDRLEVIEFPSYTPAEKRSIATQYLIPDLLRQHGLDDRLVSVPEETAGALIAGYTREAGLRGLRQQVASLCRKLAKLVLAEDLGAVTVDVPMLHELLGAPPFASTPAQTRPKVGLATSLVWTDNGGEIIFVEAARMQGSKQLILTGSLGEVLRESAQTALSYCRSHADLFGIDPDFYAVSDIHVHIPAGAVPKEGPSAGVAITIALLSLLTGRPVRQDVASTGELSLLGEVLSVGGVREKLMAARAAGITVVVLPKGCEGMVRSVEDEVLEGLDIRFVSTMEEAAGVALCDAATPDRSA
ncbi:MAG: S16 family serine protease [Pseudodesulfovibrio sp.]|jgi:ATP-dependent Lon protease|uniref:endopeptidase La n=1 Tax=Pseudodesulfovibrio indicus TaxID=1716143 RepID=A0A126QMS2_9BACT|nr:S16 family serine protease [Pseudodesulfovibrio indicus]AMK11066.1 ATP-dependent protease [Pseudodesulfovibrio indicus]TDT92076.1 ATP-dependent Lon protease [Pseudodesulfovibrio indicus]